MSMEEIANKIRSQYPSDWNIYVDDDGVLCVQSPRNVTPEQNDKLVDAWYQITAAMPRPWDGTYHVTVDDAESFEKSEAAAHKHGLKLVPTDTENMYRVEIAD